MCEASLLGVPSVFPLTGGIEEYFPKNYKLSFEQFNYEDLTKKLTLIENHDFITQIGEDNKKFITEYLNEEKLINNFMRSSMHKNTDKISVIMTTFNSQNVVERAINSILNQTYQNIEFLILDDNSEDNTHNVLKKYKNEKIVKIYKNSKNLGLTKSLNFLIKKSEGTYIARQDDDDTSSINRLEKQIQTLKKFNLDFCTARAKTIQSNKFRPGLSAYIPKNILINFKNLLSTALYLLKKTLWKRLVYTTKTFTIPRIIN